MTARAMLLWLVGSGCAEELDRPSLVQTPRVLAIVAEPPVAAPGEDVRVEALAVDPEDRPLTLSWSACARFEELRGTSDLQYAQEPTREGCPEGEEGTYPLVQDGDAGVLPGVLTQLFYDSLDALSETYGELDPDLLRFVVENSGLPIRIGLTVRAGSTVLVRAFKRVLIFTGDPRGTNPPPPRFSIGGAWVSARGVGDPWRCLPEAEPAVAARGARVVLTPDPED